MFLLVILFGLLKTWPGNVVPAVATLPLTYFLDSVQELNPEGWGPVSEEGSRRYRVALRGKQAWMRFPGWWGNSIRPPRGAYYILEVTYRDVVDQPVIAEVFGAVEVNLARSEVHRFGGGNDGKWKVACVPAGWDTLIWPKGTQSAEIGFRASSDLPIAAVKIRAARFPEDQIRYEAESRQWVARAQSAKASQSTNAREKQTPVIPSKFEGAAFVPYVRPYYEHIYPNSAPLQGETSVPIRVRMARNEYEPAAFAVLARKDIANLNYSVSELRTREGNRLRCEIRRYTAEFALERRVSPEQKNDSLVWVPQRLWPAYDAHITQGQSAWFYFTIKTLGAESHPGTYSGVVTVSSGSETHPIPIEVEVLPITLLSMEEAGLRMGGCAKGLPPAGDLQLMHEYNHNMLNIWFHGVRPEIKREGDRLNLEFYYLDDWMKMAWERGLKSIVWFLGGNPNGYPETLTIEAELYAQMYPGGKEAYYEKMRLPENRGKILPEIRTHYRQWLRDVAAHAREKNWPELIFTPFDEPAKWAYREPRPEANRKYAIGCGPWIRDHFSAACALIHDAVPQNKVYLSLHNNYEAEVHGYKGRVGEIFIPDVDIVCTNAIEDDNQLGEKVRRAGKEFWQYTGLRSPRFSFGFWFGAWDSRGSLCWAYNWGARLDITTGSNWQYAWSSPFGPVGTPAYEEMREAWDDRRYLETAKAAAKGAGKDIGPLLDRLRALAIDNQGGDNSWKTGRERAQMDEWRRRLADTIVELARR